jgi:hypothetical protein
MKGVLFLRGRFVNIQGALSGELMNNHPVWIALVLDKPVFLGLSLTHFLRLVAELHRQFLQGRHPPGNENPIRVVFLSLEDRIKDPEVGGSVGARPRAPLPSAIIGRRVAIDQIGHEPGFSRLPIDQQVFSERWGNTWEGFQ